MALHTLAENLGMTVTRLKQDMPISEYYDWVRYYDQRNAEQERRKEAADGNLMAMEPEQWAAAFGGGE